MILGDCLELTQGLFGLLPHKLVRLLHVFELGSPVCFLFLSRVAGV